MALMHDTSSEPMAPVSFVCSSSARRICWSGERDGSMGDFPAEWLEGALRQRLDERLDEKASVRVVFALEQGPERIGGAVGG